MIIKPEVSYKYTLSINDLREAVKNYIREKGGVVGENSNYSLIPLTKTRSLPSLHPSDCYDVNEFDGMDILITERKLTK